MAPDDEHNNELPEQLAEALRAADRPPPLITAGVDHELAAMAGEHFAGRPRHRLAGAAWAAMAAAVLIAVLVATRPGPVVDGEGIYTDVDDSGRIDIADVLALARSQPDRYSQAELDAFARRIVSLEPEDGA